MQAPADPVDQIIADLTPAQRRVVKAGRIPYGRWSLWFALNEKHLFVSADRTPALTELGRECQRRLVTSELAGAAA